ncbi:MAG: putative transcriptional regulator [Moritella sp.]|jgi:putative transcriptional regulator
MSKISHHPSDEMLMGHIKGDMPETISIAIAAHTQLCNRCQTKINQFTTMIAANCWQQPQSAQTADQDFDSMLDSILSEEPELSFLTTPTPTTVKVNDDCYVLPTALCRYNQAKWQQLGDISRARVLAEPGDIRASLLHIGAGGSIPNHTHKGFEITLLLAGSFEDEIGEYHAGDFIYLDSQHAHSPITKTGCLCYAVLNAPMHFTSGMSKMFNPIGHLLY